MLKPLNELYKEVLNENIRLQNILSSSRPIKIATEIDNDDVVHIVVAQRDKVSTILGVFLDQNEADKAIKDAKTSGWDNLHRESWIVQGTYFPEDASEKYSRRFYPGQKVYYIDEDTNKCGMGIILGDDSEDFEDCADSDIIYQIRPDCLDITISIYGREIKALVE